MVTCNLGYFYIINVIELITIVALKVLKLYINIYYEKKCNLCNYFVNIYPHQFFMKMPKDEQNSCVVFI
jgi:hypothetical protein